MNYELDSPPHSSHNGASPVESKSSASQSSLPADETSSVEPGQAQPEALAGATTATELDTTAEVGESLEELVRSIAVSLVDQVSRIQISEIQGHQTHIIELKVAKEDIGKVIGRQGRTADAIRTILNCASSKLSKRYILQIIDEGHPSSSGRTQSQS